MALASVTEAWRCVAEPKAKSKANANAKARRVTGASFRKMALAMPGAIEGAHMGHADFRAGKAGKIFATLDAEESKGVVMLSPEQQAALVESAPEAFSPASGAWGRRGCTVVALDRATPAAVEMALEAAWREKRGRA